MSINKKVPIPPKRNANNFPFDKMIVGDSFEVGIERLNAVKVAAVRYCRTNKKKFTTRTFKKNVGVWREK